MTAGSQVKVFPAKSIDQMVDARVVIISENQHSLVLAVGDKVPAFSKLKLTVHPEYGVVLILLRDEESRPFWRDIFTDQLFGISVAAGTSR